MTRKPPDAGILINQDFWAGLFFAAIGMLGLWIVSDYPKGTPVRLGTGFFPTMLCWGLIALGAFIAGRAFIESGERITGWALRPLIFVLAAVIAFAFLIERAGMVIGMATLIGIASLGGQDARPRELLLFILGMAAFAVLLFISGLGLPIKVWPI